MWMLYFTLEPNFFHREDYYLAQIAAEIRRSLVKNPKEVDIKSFLLHFTQKKEKEKDDSIQTKTAKSKAFWFTLVGAGKRIINGR